MYYKLWVWLLCALIVGAAYDGITPLNCNIISTLGKSSTLASTENLSMNTNAATLYFSGYEWDIRNYGSNPGPNHWTSIPDNVWVDSNGWLHLKISCINGTWYCAEVSTTQILGYGSYSFQVFNNANNLDNDIVFGLFAYKNDAHEVDIELAKWGNNNSNNTWFTVQPKPYVTKLNQESFNNPFKGTLSTYNFNWTQRNVHFEALQSQANNCQRSQIVYSFISPTRTNAEGAKANINLWLYGGHPLENNQSCEVVIKSFSFIPS